MWWRREAVCGLPFYISEPLMWSVFRFAYAQSQAWRSLRCVGLITETKRTGKTQYSRKGSFEGGLSNQKLIDKTKIRRFSFGIPREKGIFGSFVEVNGK